jgi:hypothetical protein
VHQTKIKTFIIDFIISLGHPPDIFKIVSQRIEVSSSITDETAFVYSNILNAYIHLSTQI